jgi:hypothetical protein
MIVVKTEAVKLLGAGAVTVFPFVLVHPFYAGHEALMRHERTHWEQQRRWALYGLGVGLLVWWALYCLTLPVGWNPWRYRWEIEAYRAGEGLDEKRVREILRSRPYYLWWH